MLLVLLVVAVVLAAKIILVVVFQPMLLPLSFFSSFSSRTVVHRGRNRRYLNLVRSERRRCRRRCLCDLCRCRELPLLLSLSALLPSPWSPVVPLVGTQSGCT